MPLSTTQLLRNAEQALDASPTEVLTYRPRSGGPRGVRAVVTRQVPDGLPEVPQGTAPRIRITVINRKRAVNDDTYGGIASDEVDCGGDQVDVALRIGEHPQTRSIRQLISHDAGMMTLEIR